MNKERRMKNVGFMFWLICCISLTYIRTIFWFWKRKTMPVLEKMGMVRYSIVAFLFLTMMSLPIKMLLRWTLNIKYVWVTPWFNV